MTKSGTEPVIAGLPAIIERRRTASPRVRLATDSTFVSQLIAAHERLQPQRVHRQASLGTAIAAYGEGERLDRRRLPHGFFRSADV